MQTTNLGIHGANLSNYALPDGHTENTAPWIARTSLAITAKGGIHFSLANLQFILYLPPP